MAELLHFCADACNHQMDAESQTPVTVPSLPPFGLTTNTVDEQS